MRCPCKECNNRTISCHGVCEEYKAWKKDHEDRTRWLREQRPPINDQGRKGKIRKMVEKARGWW